MRSAGWPATRRTNPPASPDSAMPYFPDRVSVVRRNVSAKENDTPAIISSHASVSSHAVHLSNGMLLLPGLSTAEYLTNFQSSLGCQRAWYRSIWDFFVSLTD